MHPSHHRPTIGSLVAALLLLTLSACGDPEGAPEAASPAPPVETPATPLDESTSDPETLRTTARLLAGLESEGDAPALPHARTWTHHAEMMDEVWAQVEERHLEAMRSWGEQELSELAAPQRPLFYPFGGPDFLSAVQLFPEAESYLLVGLEPPGHIPELEKLGADTLATELERLEGALETLVESGYFVTTRMGRDFAAESLDGALPMLYIFLARTGHTPVAIRYVAIDEDGRLRELDTVAPEAGSAVRIEFTRNGVEGKRALTYFSRDLSDDALATHPEFARYLRRLGPLNVYMKSASYLLHMPEFATLRDLLLAQGEAILQDDSGLPLRLFAPKDWDLRYFGTYTQTLPSYREWFQEDLRRIYAERTDISPLEFAIGYHSQIGGGCLILAERRSGE